MSDTDNPASETVSDRNAVIDILRGKRKILRATATRDLNATISKFEEITEANCIEAEAQILRLRRHQTELTTLSQEVLNNAFFSDNDLANELGRQNEYHSKLSDAIDLLEVQLHTMQHKSVSAPQQTQREYKSNVKTPKLELTTFEGDPLRWEEFWDDFTCSIDSRTDLSVIDKFKLLKQSLKGEAFSVADGYFITQRNYQEVKDALKDRVGDPQVAIFAHFESLLELEPASHEVDQLIRIRDKCEAHIRSFTALGLSEETYGLVFAPILLSKLPRFVKMEMHRRNGSKRWTLADLREHLKEEIRVRTKSDRSFVTSTSEGVTQSRESKQVPKAGKWMKKQPRSSSALLVQNGKQKEKTPSSSKAKPGPAHSTVKCVFCSGNHRNWECTVYPRAENRMPMIQGKDSGHNSSLCYRQFGNPAAPAASAAPVAPAEQANLVQDLNPKAPEFVPADSVHTVQGCSSGTSKHKRSGMAVLESAVVEVKGLSGTVSARVVFDNGSSLSFVRTDLAKRVGAKVVGKERTMSGRFGDEGGDDQRFTMVQLRLCLRDGSELVLSLSQVSNVSAPMRLVPLSLEGITPMIKPEEFAELVKHPSMADIDILIGLDYYYDIDGPEVWRCSSGIVVKQTVLGKILTGFLKDDSTTGTTHHQMLVTSAKVSDEDELALKRFLGIKEVAVVDHKERSDDEIAVEQFNATVRFTGNRYEVQWPFKEDPPNLPLNYDVAFRRLVSVHRKLQSSPELLIKYDNIFRDQLEKGVIEVAPKDPEGPIHFLPHHAVVTPLKETTKVRVVFDASSKPSTQFNSLNESMFRGPVFLNDLCGLLLRFRMSKLAVVSDVEKAFLQIALQKEHRDCTRLLWLQDPRKFPCPENMIVYRYARVLFGAKASPFLLAANIIHQMKLADTKVSREIMKSKYVDNVIGGQDTTMGLQQYHREAKQLFQSMSMNLREWYSNDEQFLSSIHESDRGKARLLLSSG